MTFILLEATAFLVAVAACIVIRVQLDERGPQLRVRDRYELHNVPAVVAALTIASNFSYAAQSPAGSIVFWPLAFGILALARSRFTPSHYGKVRNTFICSNLASPVLLLMTSWNFELASRVNWGPVLASVAGSAVGTVSTLAGMAAFVQARILAQRAAGTGWFAVAILGALLAGVLVDTLIYFPGVALFGAPHPPSSLLGHCLGKPPA